MTDSLYALLYLAVLVCILGAVYLFQARIERSALRAIAAALPAGPKERFQDVCQQAFSFLEEEFGFRKDPPRLFEPGFQSPYMAFYRSHHLTVVVEGLSHGARTRLCLIDREGHLLDLTGVVRRRDPDMLNVCRLAKGQTRQIPVFAEALRKCAADVLTGALTAISRVEEVRPGFSFCRFDSQSECDDFLKCHGQWRDPRDVIQPASAPDRSERVGFMSTSKTPLAVPSKYRVEYVGTGENSGEKQ